MTEEERIKDYEKLIEIDLRENLNAKIRDDVAKQIYHESIMKSLEIFNSIMNPLWDEYFKKHRK